MKSVNSNRINRECERDGTMISMKNERTNVFLRPCEHRKGDVDIVKNVVSINPATEVEYEISSTYANYPNGLK